MKVNQTRMIEVLKTFVAECDAANCDEGRACTLASELASLMRQYADKKRDLRSKIYFREGDSQ